MIARKFANLTMIEFKTREEAIAYVEAKQNRLELLEMIYAAGMLGLLSPN